MQPAEPLPGSPQAAPRAAPAPLAQDAAGEPAASTEGRWDAGQLADVATLLDREVSLGYLEWLALDVLGGDGLAAAANEVGDHARYVRAIVDALAAAGRIPEAIARLRQDGYRNGRLTVGLNRIGRGAPLDEPALQNLVNNYEAFFNTEDFRASLPRFQRAVCAIGLGEPIDAIVGSGFLIGPDLVMTNFHVLEDYLRVAADGTIEANGNGSQIYCFFDYYADPAPKVDRAACKHGSHVHAAEDWLVYARNLLEGEGTVNAKPVGKELDYAVIRLARAIGRRPARRSGGALRGWLPLPEAIDVLERNKRLIVFQHPGRAPQQFDIGDLFGPDPSGTRVRYRVSSARGSSGGATVDREGTLIALHNAEDQTPEGKEERLNQGVRIDLIRKDLSEQLSSATFAALAPAVPDETPLAFWSLSDNLQQPQPIIGRTDFREKVKSMEAAAGKRVMVVYGPPGSGRRFSRLLLQRTVEAERPVAIFSPRLLETLAPERFLRHLVDQLGILETSARPIPEPNSTENLPRWLRLDLPRWLADCLAADEIRCPGRYPAWVVIDTVTAPDLPLLWPDNLKDLVAALAGVHDPGQPAVEQRHLRWLFLGASATVLPWSGVEPYEEDLAYDDSYAREFAECLQQAWYAVEREEAGSEELLMRIARRAVRDTPPEDRRKVLAEVLSDYVRQEPREAGRP